MSELAEKRGLTIPTSRLTGRGGSVLGQLSSLAKVGTPVARVLDPSLRPERRSGGNPPRVGCDTVTPTCPPGRGRGPWTPTTAWGSATQNGGVRALPPWVVLARAAVTSVDTRIHSPGECLRQIGGVPPQAWVSIVDDRPLSRFRLRRLVRRAGLVVERELIVVPSIEAPVALVEDTELAVRAYRRTGAQRPVLRHLPWSWTGLLSSQRVVLARRR